MRLSTRPERDWAQGVAAIRAAYAAGVRLFDTAHAYALDDGELGHNERLLCEALEGREAFVVSKGGMARPEGKWRPDGRASRLRSDCEASVKALGRPIDAYLVHAPDPGTAWSTTLRALKKLHDEGLVRAIGVSNVNLARLEEALAIAPISLIQVKLSLLDDECVMNGLLARCVERRLIVMAHSPLGGPKRVRKFLRAPVLVELAAQRQVSAANVAISALLALAANVVALPGAGREETARELARVIELSPSELSRLRAVFTTLRERPSPIALRPTRVDGEVVLLMGLQGAGKSTHVAEWEARGYHRLNHDNTTGTLRDLTRTAERLLNEGQTRLVLDNTYTTRSSRAHMLDVVARFGIPTRGIWYDISLQQAQVNVIERMLTAHGRLLEPWEMRVNPHNTALPPSGQLRLLRDLEVPSEEEGFSVLERVSFIRRPATHGKPGRFVALEAFDGFVLDGDERPTAVFGWRPDLTDEAFGELNSRVTARGATLMVCRHREGPPVCWCRPPLPGLLLAFARSSGVDLSQSELIAASSAHEAMGRVVGARVSSVAV